MKILYLIHIDWNWIFQRPQILALNLDKDNECVVVEHKTIFRRNSNLTRENRRTRKMIKAYRLPKEKKLEILKKWNCKLYRNAVKDFNSYDAIWICYPSYFEYIPSDYRGKIIYDCMDNYVSMAEDSLKNEINDVEQRLIKRADLIFTSSKRLKECIPNMQKAVLVRNGYVFSDIMKIKLSQIKDKYQLGYFGTISSWFDFELLENSSKKYECVQYHLIGPTEDARLSKKEKQIIERGKNLDEGIVYHGTVEHAELQNYIRNYDALIMPFIVNETILSVDPVKLYEYISCGKCIISVWYPEIDRFAPYVYFYKNAEEYNELLRKLIVNGFTPKYDEKQQKEFLMSNTWEERYIMIKKELDNLFKGE